jgi:hypothetical protein
MSPLWKSKTLSFSIDCPPDRVYAFVSNPEDLPRWATAFAQSVALRQGKLPHVVGPDLLHRLVGHLRCQAEL